MKYLNSSFTLATCTKQMSELEYDLAVGNISQEAFDALTAAKAWIGKQEKKRLSGEVGTENVPTAA